jgi:hypothetical protein
MLWNTRGDSSRRGRPHSPFLRIAVDANNSSLWLCRAAVKRLLGGSGDTFCGEPSTASGERRGKGRVRRKNDSDERNERKRGRGCVIIIIDTAAHVLMRAAENGPAVSPPLCCVRCSASPPHSLYLFLSPFFFLSIFSFVNLLNSTLCACVGCVHMRIHLINHLPGLSVHCPSALDLAHTHVASACWRSRIALRSVAHSSIVVLWAVGGSLAARDDPARVWVDVNTNSFLCWFFFFFWVSGALVEEIVVAGAIEEGHQLAAALELLVG